MRWLAVVILVFCSCAPQGYYTADDWVEKLPRLQNFQETRTHQFDKLVGHGVIEFTWEDEQGYHRKQGDFDFWKSVDSISLRISKVGELLVWVGCDSNTNWMFNLTEDDTILRIDDEESLFADYSTLLVLMGLAPIPEGDIVVEQDVVKTTEKNGRVWKANYEAKTYKPEWIQLQDGEQSIDSHMRDWLRIEIKNTHEMNWPTTPSLIDLKSNTQDAKIKLSFAALSTIVDDEPMDRVFDLELLRKALKPKVVVGSKE